MSRIDSLLELLKETPGDSFLQHALALEHIKIGDDEGARNIFESLLLKDPAYVGSYYHLARLLERKGERELALGWYRKGMLAAQDANDGHSYQELLMAYEDLSDN